MVKQIRIGTAGIVISADRRTHVTRNGPAIPDQDGEPPQAGGADQVKWLRVGGSGTWTVRFGHPQGSPFAPGHGPANPHDITVPPGGPLAVTQGPGTYKYDVLDSAGNLKDDPDVVID